MRIILLFTIFLFITSSAFSFSDSTKKIDSSNINKIDSANLKNNAYQKILLDSNSLLKINKTDSQSNWSVIKDYFPIVVSLFSVFISIFALRITRNNFRRDHVINLFDYWGPVNQINPTNPIYNDVRNAINALTLTSIIWNYEIIDRRIIHASHWDAFQDLYDTLITCNVAPIGSLRICSSYITAEITQAYNGMSNFN